MTLRRLAYVSHVALGFAGAAFFVGLIVVGFMLMPRVESILAHSDRAAENVTTATGVWANAAVDQANQVGKITHDARASIVATGRLADKLTELAGTSRDQVKQLGPLLSSLKDSSDAAAPAIDKIGNAAQAGAELLDTTHATVSEISPLLATYQRTGNDLNAILERQAIAQILDHAAGITANSDLIVGQFEKVTKKASDDYLAPHPWYTKISRFASDTYDYGALFARHTP